MVQLGGFLGKLLGPLIKIGLPLMNNVFTPLSKNVSLPLRLTAATSAREVTM